MNQRLQQFLSAEILTQTQLADRLGVAKASVSHILAGRNKPGYDFIVSLSRQFPNLNLDWLINGKGRMYKTASEPAQEPVRSSLPQPEDDGGLLFGEDINNTKSIPLDNNVQSFANQRYIKKIAVFYSDGTFEEYSNGKE